MFPSAREPTLRTERLVLRALGPSDAADVQQLAGDYQIARTTLLIPHPYEDGKAEQFILDAAAWWQNGSAATWAVTSDGRLIGCVGLSLAPEHRRAELGYWIGRPFWGRGYATEAARAVMTWALSHGWERIAAEVFAGNDASVRVLEKLGLQPEGTLRGHWVRFGERRDTLVFGLLRDDR